MSSNQPPQPQPSEREVVFCHQCENEWYRNEHGLVCPECHGDFVEVIEANNDPREEAPDANIFAAVAPDPDEDDIDNFGWRHNGPGQPLGAHYHGTFNRNITLQPGQLGQGQGLMGLIGQALGPALQGILGGPQAQQQQQQQGQQQQEQQQQGQQQQGQQQQGQHGASGQEGRQGQRPRSPQGGGSTIIRHASGPGFHYTVTTSTRSNFGPRDANQPQPAQGQPEALDRVMASMFMNIGALPAHHAAPPGRIIFGMPPGPPGAHPNGDNGMPGGPVGLNTIFQLLGGLGIPGNGVAGDAVYSQEGLDRIITQLMEQHQAGNAPPPASEEAIESLPKRKITEKDFGDGHKADCSICMDEAELGSDVTELPCHHWFHHDCIKAWLKEHDTCPHCRQGIMPKEGENPTSRPREPGQAPLHDTHSPEYQRPRVPGEYPFPRQNSSGAGGSGTTDSGQVRRSASPRAERHGGMFSRMREAFSPRDDPSSEPSGNNNGGKNSSR